MEPDGTPHKITPHRNTRREARELVLRILFQIDVGKQPVDQVIEGALSQSILEGAYRDFAEEVARGTWEHRIEIDGTRSQHFAYDNLRNPVSRGYSGRGRDQ